MLRAAFSIAPEENFEPAMERLAELIRFVDSFSPQLNILTLREELALQRAAG